VQNMPLASFLDMALKDQTLKYEISVKTVTLVAAPAMLSYDKLQDKWAVFQEIEGQVLGADGQPLAGASVKIKGSAAGVSTDGSGRFRINAEPGQTLVVSYVGYTDYMIKIGKTSSFSIRMTLAETAMDVVVVNKGYYTEKKKLSTGNVSTVKAVDIERQPVSNPLATLQGRVPGMVITQTTGVPGGAWKVQIRGRNSIRSSYNANEPLYVVDGVPYPSSLINGMQGARYDISLGGSPLNFVNPQDIESIDVLKDADATSIYGSRAANGVILITTKKGKAGKPSVSVNIAQGFGQVGKFMELLNTRQYLDMRYEAFKNSNVDWRSPTFYYAADLKNYDTTRQTDWQKELIGGKAGYTDAQVSMSGGTNLVQYMIGGAYHREGTVYNQNANDKRGSMYYNINAASLNQRLKVGLSGGFTSSKSNLPAYDLMDYALNLPPISPAIYNADGSLNWAAGNWQNPIARFRQKYERKVTNFFSNLTIGYEIAKGLELKSNFGYSQMLVNATSNQPISSYNPTSGIQSASADFSSFTANTWIVEPQLSYSRDIWLGRFTAMVGSTIQQSRQNGMFVNATGYVSDALLGSLAAAGTITPMSSQSRSSKFNSVYGRLNYTIDDKYLLNLTMRRDGSDRFGPNNRFGNFGAAGIGWIWSQENLVAEHLPFISFGKLRASYGTTGNDGIEDFQFIRTYTVSSNTPLFQSVRGLAPYNLFNPDYKWEENRKLEFGLELGFLKDKINASASYYRNRSGNQLVGYRVPSFTGFNTVTANWPALVENSGWEFTLNTQNVQLGPVKWSSYFNIAWNRNKLVEFPGIENTTYKSTLVVGQPIDLTMVYSYAGIDPNTGIYQFRTKDGKLVDNNYPNSLNFLSDKITYLRLTPDYYGGFQNNFSYKGFELDFLFQFVKQLGKEYRAIQSPGIGTTAQGNQNVDVLNRWQNKGDDTKYAKFDGNYSQSNNNNAFSQSDGIYGDASFIRLKNLQLSYDLTKLVKRRTGMQVLKVYVQAQNLLTITSYVGMDPENQNGASLPPLRVLTAGFKLNL
ncbi:MAG: SusC/RagA family TonB-linked outer membrane protein, partial [Chitinophagaceae bacterium]|nr:SusC/RagA family TonB-linked outer membrane protein [Chitinophagaceae bacterium]